MQENRKPPRVKCLYIGKPAGFTLIELLVVIAILAILATVTVLVLNPNALFGRVRDDRRRSDMSAMRAALNLYVTTNGSFPSTGGGWWGTCPSYGGHDRSGSNGYIPNLAPTYMTQLPNDPKFGDTGGDVGEGYRCYLYNSDGVNYKLLAHFTVESQSPPIPSTDPFYDPSRSGSQPTWGVYTDGASGW